MKTSDERCDGRRTVVTALHLVMVVWGGVRRRDLGWSASLLRSRGGGRPNPHTLRWQPPEAGGTPVPMGTLTACGAQSSRWCRGGRTADCAPEPSFGAAVEL